MSESAELVEHFFRHEYGRLVGLLTRSLGVRHLELVEDAVQMAMWRGLHSWSRQGIPDRPAAWLYRTARNWVIDALRREASLRKAQQSVSETLCDEGYDSLPEDAAVEDESLRLLFLCCQPAIPSESQVALALKIVGGFSVSEIASGLLASPASIEKRITRAKARLREEGEEIATLSIQAMQARLESVLLVLYLMFNEGFSASQGESPLKRDVCDEAIRLTRMLIAQPLHGQPLLGQRPDVAAMLALMLMHSARFDTRVDADQCVVLLADQDRSAWDWSRVREAMHWMLVAARGEQLSRYHIEVAIAWEHCRAATLEATDWQCVLGHYKLLMQVAPSAMVRLNAIIAESYATGIDGALDSLRAMPAADRQQLRPWWDCTMANLLERQGEKARARSHWRDALALAGSAANRKLIEKHLAAD